LELPVELAAESTVKEAGAQPDRGRVVGLEAGQPKFRILIAEDNRENIMVLERILRKAGFQVDVATDGQQAVELFSIWHPHLIFMDVRLPVYDGIEATRRIRLLEGGREVKIVALTASVFADQKSEVLAADLDDFARKPYTFGEIFDCLERNLKLRYIRAQAAPPSPAKTSVPLRPQGLSAIPENAGTAAEAEAGRQS
jgi:CheY-like chemotaxis protein